MVARDGTRSRSKRGSNALMLAFAWLAVLPRLLRLHSYTFYESSKNEIDPAGGGELATFVCWAAGCDKTKIVPSSSSPYCVNDKHWERPMLLVDLKSPSDINIDDLRENL